MALRVITDKEAEAAVPSTGFLRDYVRYAVKQNGAPIAYHLLAGYTAFSTLVDADFAIRAIDPERPLRAPVWGQIVGESGGGKGRAIDVMTSLLAKVDPLILQGTPGSTEGLFDSVRAQPQQLIVWSDLGEFLAKTDGGYLASLRDALLAYYDCVPVQRRLTNGKDYRIDEPRLSLFGAVTPAHLEDHTDWKHWAGGLASRWVTVVSFEERFVPLAEPLDGLWQSLQDDLKAHQERRYGDCAGFTPEAHRLWVSVSRAVHERKVALAGKTRAAYSRIGVTAVRCGALAAMSMGRASTNPNDPWLLDAECLRYGLLMAQFQRRSIEWALVELCGSPYQRNRREILEFVLGARDDKRLKRGIPARMLSEISRHVKLPGRQLSELLAGLEQEGALARIQTTSSVWFQARDVIALRRREATMAPTDIAIDGDLGMD